METEHPPCGSYARANCTLRSADGARLDGLGPRVATEANVRRVSARLSLTAAGLFFLVLGMALSRHVVGMHSDFAAGFCIGAALAFLIAGFWIQIQAWRARTAS